MKSLINIFVCVIVYFQSRVRADLFTAIAGIEPLIDTHETVINHLDQFINREERKIDILKKQLNLYKEEHSKAIDDITNYLENPINAFKLIKRLTSDLDAIEEAVELGMESIKSLIANKDILYPTRKDLTGAAVALTRLQETYKLNVTELAKGMLNGVTYSSPLTSSDCFELAQALNEKNDNKNALKWMMEALKKYEEGNEHHLSLNKTEIVGNIAYIHYLQDDYSSAVDWTKKLLALDPSPQNMEDLEIYQNLEKESRNETQTPVDMEIENEPLDIDAEEKTLYEALCRGDMKISPEVSYRLKCRYLTENHPFLKLAPLKIEQLYIEPDIFLFYEVLTDSEIEFIKDLAKPRLKRAQTGSNHKKRSVADYRISMSAWLHDDESPIIARISQRITDMTGLTMDFAEELQIGNYGIGGHYEAHYDFFLKDETKDVPDRRIATVLFYMSEVAQGGATVFTELGLSVFPVKRAAAFWLNLHPSGEGDLATRHAACPVLRGSKWVANKWIHERGQELIKRCNLNYEEEGIKRKIPKPVPKSYS